MALRPFARSAAARRGRSERRQLPRPQPIPIAALLAGESEIITATHDVDQMIDRLRGVIGVDAPTLFVVVDDVLAAFAALEEARAAQRVAIRAQAMTLMLATANGVQL